MKKTIWYFYWGLGWMLLLTNCSSVGHLPKSSVYGSAAEDLLSGEAFLGRRVTPEELPNIDLFHLTPEMKKFAEAAVKSGGTTFEKVEALHYALLLPEAEGGRGIVYDAYSTQMPSVAFSQRRVNCLSFSLLYVAMARHLKINAKINEVHTPPAWNLRDKDSLFLMRHVNVRIPLRERWYTTLHGDDAIVDLEMGRYKSTYSQRYISDSLTAAQFYSNRAMELAAEGKYQDAFLYLRKALAEDNQQSYIWNNFASLFLQKELFQEAEIIYLHGLELQPDDLSIMTNIAVLYTRMGNPQQAAKYSRLAAQHRQANPYYQYALALSAFDNEEYETALTYVKRAIHFEKNEASFYQLASRIYARLGNAEAVTLMNKKYEKLSLPPAR